MAGDGAGKRRRPRIKIQIHRCLGLGSNTLCCILQALRGTRAPVWRGLISGASWTELCCARSWDLVPTSRAPGRITYSLADSLIQRQTSAESQVRQRDVGLWPESQVRRLGNG